jgi:pimeloyl-ACP methyl ester carboxylesterase
VIVLLHGILLDAAVNRRLARELASHGYRVILLDLLGHGRSDRPAHATLHRMDLYAHQVVALLDELGLESAVVGGVSLGADVALQVAVAAPARVRALITEMPVLENAAPAAALAFVPLLLTLHYLQPLFRVVARVARRVPRPGHELVDSLLNVASGDPHETAAVLHGVLLGPVAPTVEQRAAIAAPTLVIGHRSDAIHPYSDAENLAGQLPNAELLQARSIAELRRSPARLTRGIREFLDRVWEQSPPEERAASSDR